MTIQNSRAPMLLDCIVRNWDIYIYIFLNSVDIQWPNLINPGVNIIILFLNAYDLIIRHVACINGRHQQSESDILERGGDNVGRQSTCGSVPSFWAGQSRPITGDEEKSITFFLSFVFGFPLCNSRQSTSNTCYAAFHKKNCTSSTF